MKKASPKTDERASRTRRASRFKQPHPDACTECGAIMRPSVRPMSLPINGERIVVRGIPHKRCPKCGGTVTDLESTKRLFQQAYVQYRERHGLLAGDEIRAIRTRHRLTQAQLAKLLGLGTNTLSRWESDRIVQTVAMDVLLRLVRDVPGNLAYLRRHRA